MNTTDKPLSDIRVAAMASNNLFGMLLKVIGPIIDRILGLNKLQKIYLRENMSRLDKQVFSAKLLEQLGVQISGGDGLLQKVPKEGKCVIVCNHPYGMIEGVIIARLLTAFRTDTKIMANVGLQTFKEIEDYFIFANPLKPKAAINTSAIKKCFKHVKNDGLLVIFPAGKVSSYQADKQRITDAEWNRLAVQIANKTKAPILPVFISGTNSPLFHRMGRIYYRFRLLMLVREMLKLEEHEINLTANNLIEAKHLKSFGDIDKMNDYVRLQCYLNDKEYVKSWPESISSSSFKAIIPAVDKQLIKNEIANLPAENHLVDVKTFSVYYAYQDQAPACVKEITRLREITFRKLDEGSGESCDTDKFDATYMHLFIYDHESEGIIGAYRMGQTDILFKDGDVSKSYLSQMFDFSPEFMNRKEPCLEMGRSFIVESHQNTFYGLALLWKGIGAFVCKNPRYKIFYGTVSLSKLYDTRSVALMNNVMITSTEGVTAHTPFEGALHPEAQRYTQDEELSLKQLSALVSGVEPDQKGVPVLLKQYHKLGAKFHLMGIDTNFNQTPGLLLSVDLSKTPEKLLSLYFGNCKEAYEQYDKLAADIK